VLLRCRPAEQLAGLAEKAAGVAAPKDALTLAEAAGLKLA
jgi:hypothetical protein